MVLCTFQMEFLLPHDEDHLIKELSNTRPFHARPEILANNSQRPEKWDADYFSLQSNMLQIMLM